MHWDQISTVLLQPDNPLSTEEPRHGVLSYRDSKNRSGFSSETVVVAGVLGIFVLRNSGSENRWAFALDNSGNEKRWVFRFR